MSERENLLPANAGMIADLRLLPRPFYLLMAGSFINRFGHFVIPFLAIYLRQLGFTPAVTGYALASYGAGGFFASILGGYLADRIGRKPTLLISCFGAATAMMILAFAKTIPSFVTGAFLSGLMTSLYYPASSSLTADLVVKELRVRAFAVQRLIINLATACGMMTAGLVAATSFFWLFVADAATTVILGLIVLFGLKKGIGKKASAANAGWGAALPVIRRDGAFLRAVGASFLTAVVFWQTGSTLGLQVTEGSGLDEKAYGFLLGLNGLMIVFFELPLTNLTRGRHPQRVMALGYALMGGGLALLAFGSGTAMLIVSMMILTIGEMVSSPVASTYVANLAPDDMRGRYMGVNGFSWSIAAGVGPMTGLWIYGNSPVLLWVFCGVVGLAAAGLILIRPKNPPQTAESP
ncbi:MAG: MDR family MFS transporter [Akkermansiaceae bacterium]